MILSYYKYEKYNFIFSEFWWPINAYLNNLRNDARKQEVNHILHLDVFSLSWYEYSKLVIMFHSTYHNYAGTKQTEKERLSFEYTQQTTSSTWPRILFVYEKQSNEAWL